MRPVAALLACVSAAALATALADPPAASTTTTATTTTSSTAAPAPAADKPAVNPDVEHFLAEGYKPETRGGHEVYCRKENQIGTRVGAKTVCSSIEELRVKEERAKDSVHQSQGH